MRVHIGNLSLPALCYFHIARSDKNGMPATWLALSHSLSLATWFGDLLYFYLGIGPHRPVTALNYSHICPDQLLVNASLKTSRNQRLIQARKSTTERKDIVWDVVTSGAK